VHESAVLPAVLAGGRSTRFGRDKLMEHLAGAPLVARPIAALRVVFGPRVLLAGTPDPRVAALADGVLPDERPGCGPLGAIVTALRHAGRLGLTGGAFVLAGDMPGFDAPAVRTVLQAAAARPAAWAVLASHDGPLPCAGLYRPAALPTLETALQRGHFRLRDLIPDQHLVLVPVSDAAARNVNTPADLPPT